MAYFVVDARRSEKQDGTLTDGFSVCSAASPGQWELDKVSHFVAAMQVKL